MRNKMWGLRDMISFPLNALLLRTLARGHPALGGRLVRNKSLQWYLDALRIPQIDAEFELRSLLVLQLKLAEAIAQRFGYHHLARPQTDRQVAHLQLRLDMIRDLADDRGAGELQFRLDAQVYRAISGAVQPLPAHLPRGAQPNRRRHQKAIENQLVR